ncbi:MAG: WG repeat-containing protein, partial [Paludibacteraceae bacterium]
MKKNTIYLAGLALIAAGTLCVMGCSKEKPHEVELSERISKVQQSDGSYKLVNTETGKTLISDISVEWITTGRDSLAVFAKDDKRGYFNVNTGEIIIEPTYKHAWVFSEGLAGVVQNDRVGFINSKGEVVIDFQYPYRGNSLSSFVFHQGRCVVANTDQRLGVIDTLGNWIIQPQ